MNRFSVEQEPDSTDSALTVIRFDSPSAKFDISIGLMLKLTLCDAWLMNTKCQI
jgi:hypothetical protein